MTGKSIVRLAAAAVLSLAAASAHAVPVLSTSLSPPSVPTGGSATLSMFIFDDGIAGFTAGALTLPYPLGLVNVGGASYNDCGGVVAALPGSNVLAVTGMSLAPSAGCSMSVPVTSAVAGTYTVVFPAGIFVASSGSNAAASPVTLNVVAPLMVTHTGDTGAGSLRDAITTANATCAAGLGIQFNIAGAGPHTIQPATQLPTVTCSGLSIDAFTQPGASANTQPITGGDDANLKIILNGAACTGCNGFTVSGTNNVAIRGFSIHSFQGAGIEVDASSTNILGNYIGTDPGGMTPLGNGVGVHVSSGYAMIGTPSALAADRNLITANGTGIHSQSGAYVYNTQVGGRRDGGLGMGNSGRGIFYNASNYTSQNVEGVRVLGNGAQGISVDSATVTRVLMRPVVSFGNGGIGIDLGDDGPTANDESGPPYDTDGGPNRLVNYPVVTSVSFDGFTTTVTGYIKSEPGSDFTAYLFTNSAPSSNTQGETFLEAFSGTLDANGFYAFTRFFSGSKDNVSAQMTADVCGDGCVYSSEFSPSVAATATFFCSLLVRDSSVGDAVVSTPTVIVNPGSVVQIIGCQADTYSWNTGETQSQIAVTAPAAGVSATYTLNATKAGAAATVTVTLIGAAVGTPVCTLAPSVALPMDPSSPAPFQVNATCSPAATGFTWSPTFTYPLQYDAGQGTPTATYHFVSPDGGVGYHVYMTPTNAAGEGPTATRVLWVNPLKVTQTSLAFPTTPAGTTSAPLTIDVRNYSSYYQPYLNIVSSPPYIVTNNCALPMATLSTCTIDVQFAPTVAGTNQTGSVTISFSFPGNPTHTVTLTGDATGAPAVGLSASSLTFAARTVNSTSAAQTVTLANNGTATLSIGSINISGDFAFTSGCSATLAPGASCTIDVTFTPLLAGARAGTLTVSDNASGAPHVVTLTGTGLSSAAAVLEVSPGVVVFSPQPVGSDSPPQSVIVSNSGTAPLTFTSIGITGEFSIVPPPAASTPAACPVTLLPGGACRIDVKFHPVGFNSRRGTLDIATNGGSIALSLVGTGMVPEPPQLEVPPSLDFGTRPVGTRSPGQPAALHNVSPYVASVIELTASGDFAVSEACTNIAIGATCSPEVTFQPTAVGTREGALTVRTLRDVDPYVIRLLGNGIENLEPALEVSVTQVGFGNAFVGQHITRDITLRNVGQAVLQVSEIVAPGDFLTNGACIGPIAPNASCTFAVTFAPSGAGGRGSQLQILSNAPDSPRFVTLSGSGCFVPSPSRARAGMLLCGP